MLILLGKTCSGKDTIVNKLVEEYGYKKIVTYTTRPMRDGEVDGATYHFISEEDFLKKHEEGFFLETKMFKVANGDTWFYGCSKESILNSERKDVIILTPNGYVDFLKNCKEIVPHKAFYIRSKEHVIRDRLEGRGDFPKEADRRVKSDNYDFRYCENWIRSVWNNGDKSLNDIIEHDMGIKKKPKRKNIYIDLDCTTYNTIKRIVEMYDEDYSYYANYEKVNWEDCVTWNFDELKCANQDYFNRCFNMKRFFDKVEMFEGAKETIDALSKRYNIVFCSMGSATNLRAKTDYVKKNFPYAKFCGVNIKNADKRSVDMSDGIIIDDREDNLNKSNASIKLCFGRTYSWNENFDAQLVNNFRVNNWEEIGKLLLV